MKSEVYALSELVILFDKKRIPLSAMERVKRSGSYRYYGAQGVIDYIDDYIFDGQYMLIAEDGENLKSNKQNIAQLVSGRFWLNNHAHIVQCNEKANMTLLCYYLNHTDLSGYITGSAQPKLSQTNLNAITVRLPSRTIQDRIASIIDSIDGKIASNTQINHNLEQQALTLFRSWFINFEPFSEDGTMPSLWSTGYVSDIIELHDSRRIPLSGSERDKMEKVYPYYGATSLMDYVDNYLFDGIYLLLGEDGTVIDSLGFPILQYVDGKFWVNNHAHILTGKRGYSVEELYLFFRLTNIRSIVTGAVQQKVSQANLKKVPAVLPPEDCLHAFDELIQPLFAQIRNLRNESNRLTQLRDALLPKLMSGELDVSEVDI